MGSRRGPCGLSRCKAAQWSLRKERSALLAAMHRRPVGSVALTRNRGQMYQLERLLCATKRRILRVVRANRRQASPRRHPAKGRCQQCRRSHRCSRPSRDHPLQIEPGALQKPGTILNHRLRGMHGQWRTGCCSHGIRQRARGEGFISRN